MPNYTLINERESSVLRAKSVQSLIKSAYEQAKATQGVIQLYLSGTDAEFNASIDEIFISSERTTLNAMLTNLNTLVTAWETDALKREMLGLAAL